MTAPRSVEARVLCIGGAAIDTTFVARHRVVPGTSNPATGSRAFGGVARNVAENLARLGVRTGLMSCVGGDDNGRRLTRHLADLEVDTSGIEVVAAGRTAEYIALLEPDRNLSVGVADMAIFDHLDAPMLRRRLASADWVFADCNCTAGLLQALLQRPNGFAGRIAVDAVSVAKSERLPARPAGIDLLFLNLDEAAAVLQVAPRGLDPHDALRGLLGAGAGAVVLTLGAAGVLVGQADAVPTPVPAIPGEVADVTGAGDALVAAVLAAILAGASLPDAVRWGCLAATLTLERVGSTRADLSFALLEARARQSVSSPI